jgi:hypothetical protein
MYPLRAKKQNLLRRDGYFCNNGGCAPDCPVHLLPPGKHLDQTIQGFCQGEAKHWHHLLYQKIMEKGDLSS